MVLAVLMVLRGKKERCVLEDLTTVKNMCVWGKIVSFC